MGNRLLSAVLVAAAGVLLIIIPQFIFPVCETPFAGKAELGAHSALGRGDFAEPVPGPHAPLHMACFYTAKAEAGLGAAVILTGLLLLVFNSSERRLGVSLSLAPLAALAGATPWFLIGVCPSDMMLCRSGTLPALLLLSAALLAYALLNSWYLHKYKRPRHV
jgi:hypothetical protein